MKNILRRDWVPTPIHITMNDLISSQSLLLAGCSLQNGLNDCNLLT